MFTNADSEILSSENTETNHNREHKCPKITEVSYRLFNHWWLKIPLSLLHISTSSAEDGINLTLEGWGKDVRVILLGGTRLQAQPSLAFKRLAAHFRVWTAVATQGNNNKKILLPLEALQ